MMTNQQNEENSDSALLLSAALEFGLIVAGEHVRITRYDNHRNRIPDGKWVVCWHQEWYLNGNGDWQYKRYAAFESPQHALDWLRAYPPAPAGNPENAQKG